MILEVEACWNTSGVDEEEDEEDELPIWVQFWDVFGREVVAVGDCFDGDGDCRDVN